MSDPNEKPDDELIPLDESADDQIDTDVEEEDELIPEVADSSGETDDEADDLDIWLGADEDEAPADGDSEGVTLDSQAADAESWLSDAADEVDEVDTDVVEEDDEDLAPIEDDDAEQVTADVTAGDEQQAGDTGIWLGRPPQSGLPDEPLSLSVNDAAEPLDLSDSDPAAEAPLDVFRPEDSSDEEPSAEEPLDFGDLESAESDEEEVSWFPDVVDGESAPESPAAQTSDEDDEAPLDFGDAETAETEEEEENSFPDVLAGEGSSEAPSEEAADEETPVAADEAGDLDFDFEELEGTDAAEPADETDDWPADVTGDEEESPLPIGEASGIVVEDVAPDETTAADDELLEELPDNFDEMETLSVENVDSQPADESAEPDSDVADDDFLAAMAQADETPAEGPQFFDPDAADSDTDESETVAESADDFLAAMAQADSDEEPDDGAPFFDPDATVSDADEPETESVAESADDDFLAAMAQADSDEEPDDGDALFDPDATVSDADEPETEPVAESADDDFLAAMAQADSDEEPDDGDALFDPDATASDADEPEPVAESADDDFLAAMAQADSDETPDDGAALFDPDATVSDADDSEPEPVAESADDDFLAAMAQADSDETPDDEAPLFDPDATVSDPDEPEPEPVAESADDDFLAAMAQADSDETPDDEAPLFDPDATVSDPDEPEPEPVAESADDDFLAAMAQADSDETPDDEAPLFDPDATVSDPDEPEPEPVAESADDDFLAAMAQADSDDAPDEGAPLFDPDATVSDADESEPEPVGESADDEFLGAMEQAESDDAAADGPPLFDPDATVSDGDEPAGATFTSDSGLELAAMMDAEPAGEESFDQAPADEAALGDDFSFETEPEAESEPAVPFDPDAATAATAATATSAKPARRSGGRKVLVLALLLLVLVGGGAAGVYFGLPLILGDPDSTPTVAQVPAPSETPPNEDTPTTTEAPANEGPTAEDQRKDEFLSALTKARARLPRQVDQAALEEVRRLAQTPDEKQKLSELEQEVAAAMDARAAALLGDITRAVGDAQQFHQQLQGYVESHPGEDRSADFQKVLDEELSLVERVGRWSDLLSRWSSQDMRGLASQQADELAVEAMGLVASCADFPEAENVRQRLEIVKAIAARVDAEGQPIFTQLSERLAQPMFGDLRMLRTKDGKQFYLAAKPARDGDDATFEYIVDGDLSTQPGKIALAEMAPGGYSRTPQGLLARSIRKRLEEMADNAWESTFFYILQDIDAQPHLDPVVKSQLMKQALSIACQGSHCFASAHAEHLNLLTGDPAIDAPVAWMDPDDEEAQQARAAAVDLLTGLPDLIAAGRAAGGLFKQLKSFPAGSQYQWIGWLSRDAQGNWTCHTGPDASPAAGELYVVYDAGFDDPLKLERIGQLDETGPQLQSPAESALLEGRPVYVVDSARGGEDAAEPELDAAGE